MLENNNYKIGISVLDCDYLNLGRELIKIEKSGADFIHLDIMDGNFVSQIAFGQKMVSSLVKSSNIPVRTHLMIINTDEQIESYVKLNPNSITVHAETCRHLDKVLSMITYSGISAGVALNPSTPISFIENVLDKINSVLILTVNPGFGGQDFIESMLAKIKKTRELINNYYQIADRKNIIGIKVDGGINAATITKAKNAGADEFIIGSSFFKSSNPAEFIGDLRNLMHRNQTI